MTWLRSLAFAIVSLAAMVLAAVLCLPLLVLARPAAAAVARAVAAFNVAAVEAICGLRVELRGLEWLAGGPFLIAAKHQSALETYVLTARLPGAAFVLKREILRVPLAGWYVAALRPIAVDRSAGAGALKAMLKAARQAVAEGRDVVIFPEGTRTGPRRTAPYQPGVAALYGDLGLPVVPVALDTGMLWPRKSLLKRPGRATIAFLEPIAPGLPRREFMELLQQRIEAGCRALDAEKTWPEVRG